MTITEEKKLPDVAIKDLRGHFSFEDAGESVWEDDDGNLFPWPLDVTPEINLFQAAVIATLLTGIAVYAILSWAL